ncbi:hypothetical protein [Achromobacter xylosoxidans]|uniref:hypothetical protein n=1 Tax=Alcaligenes xylosoxydans xylosoxydans TaxID=85698 RepID=UPI001EEAAFB9|nr:hypothetical protein [Achromobacter xylosoxidans]
MKENNAAQAANDNPLSDEYVNAVIQRHGYDSPESVIAQLHQWIGLHGGENTVTLLMYEAHKALSKLRAPVADERAQHDNWYSRTHMHEYSRDATWRGWKARAALASSPAVPKACPTDVCQAGKADGVLCANDECDRANGVRLASAPVAPTTDRAMLQSVLQDLEKSESVCPRCGHSDSCADMDVAHMIRDHLKGEASAPVAGEAQRRGKFLQEHVTQQMIWNVQAVIEAECNGLALDTRQARNVMSFLMNEHGPDAAPQASAAPCTCPSGGGSLRHPCPAHPQTNKGQA